MVTYGTTAADYWAGQGDVVIHDVTGSPIATIPLRFMIAALANTWSYINTVVSDCVDNEGYLTDPQGNRIGEDTEVKAGSYKFVRTGKSNIAVRYCTFKLVEMARASFVM